MRTIDADALKDNARGVIPHYHAAVVMNLFDLIDNLADNMPTIDAVPVVRCKDCKNMYEDVGGTVCVYGAFVDCITPNDFYCAFGERREDD